MLMLNYSNAINAKNPNALELMVVIRKIIQNARIQDVMEFLN
jgi:hypothetical protein